MQSSPSSSTSSSSSSNQRNSIIGDRGRKFQTGLRVPPPPSAPQENPPPSASTSSSSSSVSTTTSTTEVTPSVVVSPSPPIEDSQLQKSSSKDDKVAPESSPRHSLEPLTDSSSTDPFKNQSKTAKFTSRIPATGHVNGRFLHTAVNYEDFMFVFAGINAEEKPINDFTCFHFASRSWSTIETDSNIAPRCDHTAVVYADSMFVYGGRSGDHVFDDLIEFKFETQSWNTIQGDGQKPGPRCGHSVVVHENSMYVFGGRGADEKPNNDLYEFSLETMKWSKVTPTSPSLPPARHLHSCVLFKDSIFIFGGTDANGNKLGDHWEFKIRNKMWAQINVSPAPPARTGHTAVVFQNSMYLCGGDDASSLEVFEFDFDFRKWYRVHLLGDTSSSKTFSTAVTRGESIFFFGGLNEHINELDYLCLGKDEFEDDLDLDENAKMQNIPKVMWEASAMKKHPEILELRERLRPLSKAPSYGRNVISAKTESKQAITAKVVLQLLMEHLEREGYKSVVDAIQEESNVQYQRYNLPESRLMTLLRIGRRRLRQKDIFSPDIQLADYDELDPEVPMIDHLPGRLEDKDVEQDVNIWDEQSENKKNVIKVKDEVSEKMVIKAATLNKLIQHLTSEKEKVHDVQFMRTFLYTYQSFTSPEMLLKKLIQRYNVPMRVPEDKFKAYQQPIRSRVCHVIKYWIDKCAWDWNEKLLASLNAFIDGPLSRDGNLPLVKQLRNSINKLMKKWNSTEEERSYVFGVNPPEPKVPKNIFSQTLNVLAHVEEVEIARQLTLIEFNIFAQIMPTEFLNKSWCDPDMKHKCTHITESLNRFNDMINWVAYSIVSIDNKRGRARMIEKFIKIAENLKTLKNFQTLFAVLAGVNSSAVTRLGQSWAEVAPRSKEILSDLTSIMSRENNYRTYREFLRYSALPCIPFLDVVLKDLLTIEEQNSDNINGLINFQKRQLLFKAITNLQGYQQRPYNLQPVHQIATVLSNFPKREDAYELSLKMEPKTNSDSTKKQ